MTNTDLSNNSSSSSSGTQHLPPIFIAGNTASVLAATALPVRSTNMTATTSRSNLPQGPLILPYPGAKHAPPKFKETRTQTKVITEEEKSKDVLDCYKCRYKRFELKNYYSETS
ncbi:hypothetical protein BDR07DRAFT_1478709 [Suillus spraguei]|nr:hypothetical protein BDR07DRAFT_1478709 [Suillus spraguei]